MALEVELEVEVEVEGVGAEAGGLSFGPITFYLTLRLL